METCQASVPYFSVFDVGLTNQQGNVLIQDDGRACLSDFGFCHVLGGIQGGSSLASRTCFPGTYQWAAPELLVSADEVKASTQSDIFAFGCLMLQVCVVCSERDMHKLVSRSFPDSFRGGTCAIATSFWRRPKGTSHRVQSAVLSVTEIGT